MGEESKCVAERCEAEKFPLFADMTDEELSLIETHWKERHYKKGQSLFRRGRPCTQCLFVSSGQAKLTLLSANGKEQIIQTLGPGETCACHTPGLAGGSRCSWKCSVQGEALSDCRVYLISNDSLAQLFQLIPSLHQRFNVLLSEKVRAYVDLIEDISLRPSFERVAHFLLKNVVNFSQEELSRRLGMARETASRHLNKLKRMKLIEIRPQEIVVVDRKGLEELVYGEDVVSTGG